MAEIIQFRDLQAARERAHRRASDHQNIERALGLMRENLVWAAERLRTVPLSAQPELLDRIEKLAATIRYGMVMLGEAGAEAEADGSNGRR
jgi:hypothetical protein